MEVWTGFNLDICEELTVGDEGVSEGINRFPVRTDCLKFSKLGSLKLPTSFGICPEIIEGVAGGC